MEDKLQDMMKDYEKDCESYEKRIKELEFLLKRAMNCPKNKPALCDDCRDKIQKALKGK